MRLGLFLYIFVSMEVTRLYPARMNNGVELRTRKDVLPNTVVSHEEYPHDLDMTIVIANGETFIIDEQYDDFGKRLKTERLTSSYDNGAI